MVVAVGCYGPGLAYALSAPLPSLPLLEQAVEHASAMGMMGSQSLRVTRLGEAYLDAGRLEDARICALQVLELAQTHKEPTPGMDPPALRRGRCTVSSP